MVCYLPFSMMPFWMMCAFVARFWGVIIQCAESEKQTKPCMTCAAQAGALRRMGISLVLYLRAQIGMAFIDDG